MVKKKETAAKPPVWVAVVIDESGSMIGTKEGTISGFNEYLQDRQRDAKDMEVRLWLTKFNYQKTVVHDGVLVNDVPALTGKTYNPDGGTALLDAVGSTIFAIESRESVAKIKPKIVVLIMTDGQENASQFFVSSTIQKLVKAKEASGNWTFVYMGANQDSWAASASLGILRGNTVNYSNDTAKNALLGASVATMSISYSDNMQSNNSFTVDGAVPVECKTAEAMSKAKVDKKTGKITLKP